MKAANINIKQIPNALSAIRIPISIYMIFVNNSGLFIICYLLCGLTDVFDGYIARRYKLESKFGEKLDSFADMIFWAVIFYLFLLRTDIFTKNFIIGACVVFILRMINLLITKIKFKQWGMLHSWGNKITGIMLYIFIPVCIISGKIYLPIIILAFSTAVLSSINETTILLTAKYYDANRRI